MTDVIVNLDIKKGDTIIVYSQNTSRTGIVDSASNYGNLPWKPEPCWYIEFTDPVHGAVYWKQDGDGGTVEVLERGVQMNEYTTPT